MPFLCPRCSRHGSLRITLKIELPPDSRSDEITLQTVRCADCGFAGIAVYEESRRGALDTESFQHTGYEVTRSQLRGLRRIIKSCPDPGDRRCPCATHQRLGKTDSSGRWSALGDLETTGTFALDR
jgi:hypothetical protein